MVQNLKAQMTGPAQLYNSAMFSNGAQIAAAYDADRALRLIWLAKFRPDYLYTAPVAEVEDFSRKIW